MIRDILSQNFFLIVVWDWRTGDETGQPVDPGRGRFLHPALVPPRPALLDHHLRVHSPPRRPLPGAARVLHRGHAQSRRQEPAAENRSLTS